MSEYCDQCGDHLTRRELQAWRDAASNVGDADTALIARIALGEEPVESMSVEEIAAEYASEDPGEVYRLQRAGQHAAQIVADRWGSPYAVDRND